MAETLNNNITEVENTAASTEAEKTVETKTDKPVEKTYTEEEFKKAQQSAASKAKFELLTELNIKSVQEFKEKETAYNEAISEKESLTNQVKDLSNKLSMQKLGVKEESMDDFLVLATKRVSETTTLEQSFEEVAKAYPNMLKETTPKVDVKTGVEKSEGSKGENQYSEDMLKRYPFLKSHKKI